MPIRPEMRGQYPPNWAAISMRIRFDRAAGHCECPGNCGATPHETDRCDAVHGQPHPLTGSRVVLTVAHLDHTPANCNESNLRALCQRCHLAYDAEQHKAQASHTRALTLAGDAPALFEVN